jgi:hypothetical protein
MGRALFLVALMAAMGPPAARAGGAAAPAVTVSMLLNPAPPAAGRPSKLEARLTNAATKAVLKPADFQASLWCT